MLKLFDKIMYATFACLLGVYPLGIVSAFKWNENNYVMEIDQKVSFVVVSLMCKVKVSEG